MRLATAVTIAAAAALSGCAAPPQMSRSEYLAATSRTYPDQPEKVIAAAEQVLKYADGDDVKFAHSREGFNATRAWSIYLVVSAAFGTDVWSVRVVPQNAGSLIEVQVGTTSQAVTPMATTSSGTWTAGTLPSNAIPVTGPALYELFFERLDYLLGLRTVWPACSWSDDRVSAKKTYGNNEALCNVFNVVDDVPPKATVVGIRAGQTPELGAGPLRR